MNVRHLAVVASVALGLLAPTAHAGGSKGLDGKRTTHTRYSGTLSQPAFQPDPSRLRLTPSPIEPDRGACTTKSCDVTSLKLTVPRGSSAGRFTVTVRAARELNVGVYLYDAAGTEVMQADIDRFDGVLPPCCTSAPDTTYTRGFVIPRLDAGRYALVVYNRGGYGNFTADVIFTSHPPDRPAKKK